MPVIGSGIDIPTASPLVDTMASANKSSPHASSLAPLAGSLWIFFLVLTAIVAPIWAFDLGEAQIRAGIRVRELQAALLWLSSIADIGWLTIAALLVYASVAGSAGLARARGWALLVLAGSWLTAALSVWSGWPLGAIHFTGRLGFLVGPVSVGWLLLWCVTILGARDLVLFALPRASHLQASLLVGVSAALTDLNLEPFAAKTRAWWLWMTEQSHVNAPREVQSSLTWFIVALTAAWCLRSPLVTSSSRGTRHLPRSAQVFLLLNLLLLIAHLGNLLRR